MSSKEIQDTGGLPPEVNCRAIAHRLSARGVAVLRTDGSAGHAYAFGPSRHGAGQADAFDLAIRMADRAFPESESTAEAAQLT